MVAIGTVKAEGKREQDYFHDYRDTNTIELEVFSDEIIRAKDKTNDVFAYSKTLRINHHKPVWNNTLDMETGTVAASTKYYNYFASTGERVVSLEKYYTRNDLRGRYHPYEAWRYIGSGTTDGTSDWESKITGIAPEKIGSEDAGGGPEKASSNHVHQVRGTNALTYGAEVATNALLGLIHTLALVQTDLTSGTLVIGDRYFIETYVAGDVFTDVGASSNATGVEFIATGTTPTPWSNGSTIRRVPVLANPTNKIAGETYTWKITQPAGGGVRVAFGTDFNFFGNEAVNVSANGETLITGVVNTSSELVCFMSGAGERVYSEANGDFIATAGGWTTGYSALIPYQMDDGSWRVKGNIYGGTGSITALTLTISGITGVGFIIACSVMANANVVTGARKEASSSNFQAYSNGAGTAYTFSFDIPLASKPVWAD